MTITLKSGKTLEAVNVEESYSPRIDRGACLSIYMDQKQSVEDLRGVFTPEETSVITVADENGTAEIAGYTVVDSIRRLYNGRIEYNTVVDLTKKPTA